MSERPGFNSNLDPSLTAPGMLNAVAPQPAEILPEPPALTASTLPDRLLNEQGAMSLEFLHNGVDRTALAFIGLRKTVAKRRLDHTQSTNGLEVSAGVYQNVAEVSLAKKDPVAPYDPLSKFAGAHRTRRAGFGERPQSPRDTSQDAVTTLQQQAARRANLHVDALNAHEEVQHKFTSLYGDVLRNKDALKQEFKNGRYTHAQKKSMKTAGKQVRNAAASEERIRNRLEDSMAGQDMPGRVIQGRLDRKQRRAHKLTKHLQHLDRLKEERERRLAPEQPNQQPTAETPRQSRGFFE